MGWYDTGILLAVGAAALVAGIWASKRISDALDWLSDDLSDAARLSDSDADAMRRELLSR